jgi:ABC-type phosphate transport system substrate-binding protein
MRKHRLAVAAAVAAGALGLTGTVAQAQTTGVHVTPDKTLSVKPSTVAAGVATGVSVQNPCPNGTAPTSVTGLPAANGTSTAVQASLIQAPKPVVLAGVWPPTGGPYTITVSCPGGQSGTGTVKVKAGPSPTDLAGVGADATGSLLDQFSGDYNAKNTSGSGFLYSWDAVNPVTNGISDTISAKQGCAGITRPNGSGAGITALTTQNPSTSGQQCIDFARSSSPRGSSTPNSVTFVTLAEDAVAYAVQPGTNAPANLTTADLTGIYNCSITNWKQIGGKSGTIAPFIPLAGSGLRSFFLAAIGLATPGACVSDDNGTLVESEGVNPVLNTNKANVIVPYSVGKYIAERYHSAKCFNTTCTPTGSSNNLICTPKGPNDLFGCDTRGTLNLGVLNSTDPTTPWPLTKTTKNPVINSGFTATFLRFLYDVVCSPNSSGSGANCTNNGAALGIPNNLQPVFSSTGWACTSSTAQADIKKYGFLTLPAGAAPGECGSLS